MKAKPKSAPELGQAAYSRSAATTLHVLFVGSILSDAAICGLAAFLYLHPVWLSKDPDLQQWYSRLPALASIIGSAVTGLNSWCLTLIITARAKRLVLGPGVTLGKLEAYTQIAMGGYPRGFNFLVVFALALMAIKPFIGTAIVQTFTPTLVIDDVNVAAPYVSFAASSFPNGQPDIAKLMDGFNCPINNEFGSIYDAGIQTFTDTIPENYTRLGVSYPNDLSGISGAISVLATDSVRALVGSETAVPSPLDVMKVCVPRAVIETTCSPTLRAGYSVEAFRTDLGLTQPAGITNFTLFRNGEAIASDTFPDYTHGSLVVFGRREPTLGGMSSIFIINTGNYNQDLGSATIECNVTATEQHIPIRIIGGTSVVLSSDFGCLQSDQPSAEWLPHLTFLSQMVLQKQQGQDGRLESVMLFQPNETVTRIEKLQEAITRMVSVGATEMYANLYAQLSNSSSTAAYPRDLYYYGTPRLRLGNATWESLLFLLAPAFFMGLLSVGWLCWGLTGAGCLKFDPLNNAATAIAGMNSFDVPPEIREECVADMDRLTKRTSHLRFRYAVNPREPSIVGLTADPLAPPLDRTRDRKSLFGSSASVRSGVPSMQFGPLSPSSTSPGGFTFDKDPSVTPTGVYYQPSPPATTTTTTGYAPVAPYNYQSPVQY
ncbi:hypothetical protein OIV83_005122 [Microbotryomycetes sp. JL201]|nr:hypothetical protein OIV83_005122 [Microbotryomycetes sp. JL201]